MQMNPHVAGLVDARERRGPIQCDPLNPMSPTRLEDSLNLGVFSVSTFRRYAARIQRNSAHPVQLVARGAFRLSGHLKRYLGFCHRGSSGTVHTDSQVTRSSLIPLGLV
ncbi:hypothetical protein CHARACLAT_032823 [Characodon lateralis]|uniref:Uncharacterized protein n=1 Tax=Characodon lateralis TaxID=208331 RepID=A0ABU7DXC5_9TELE|nr:hypothetical protein [Characodon lateralis]